jgi:lipoate-protein ligase B
MLEEAKAGGREDGKASGVLATQSSTVESSSRLLLVVGLGQMPYGEALELQRAAAAARIRGDIDQDLLLLVEHPHVVTLGRSSKTRHLVASPELLAARGVALFEVERGGDVTYHGPGQLVGYPIIDLKRHRQDLHWYLRQVEETLIVALRAVGITAGRHDGYTGVWVDSSRKIASIGVHARDWVTWHGFALNVSTDLSYFDFIIPCGIPDVDMTSVQRELGRAEPSIAEVAGHVAAAFEHVFDLRAISMSREELVRSSHVIAAAAAPG